MAYFPDLIDRASRLLGKVTLIDSAQADAIGALPTGVTQDTGGIGLYGLLGAIKKAVQGTLSVALPTGAATDATLIGGALRANTRALAAAVASGGGAVVPNDIVIAQRLAVTIYSRANNITAETSSPYVLDTTLYNTYNVAPYISVAGHFSTLQLDVLAYLVGGSATATATIFLQRLLADGATWATIFTEQIASAGIGVTTYVGRYYTIGAGVAPVNSLAAGTQTIVVNGVSQTFTITTNTIPHAFMDTFRIQVAYSGAGAALTLFNISLKGE